MARWKRSTLKLVRNGLENVIPLPVQQHRAPAPASIASICVARSNVVDMVEVLRARIRRD